jgi:DNA polymerase III epsilon subunit family exonuclease
MNLLDRNLAKTPFAVVDFETTGLNPNRDRVCEVAVVVVVPGKEPRLVLDTLVDPGQPIPNAEIHGITDEFVRGAPQFADIAIAVRESLASRVIVAHNARFDLGFLQAEMERTGALARAPYLCTMQLEPVAASSPSVGYSRALGHLCGRYGIAIESAHTARDDAMADAYLLRHQLRTLRKRGVRTFGDLRREAAGVSMVESFDEHLLAAPAQLAGRTPMKPRGRDQRRPSSAMMRYFDAALTAVADLQIDPDELLYVAKVQEESGLSKSELRAVHARLFAAMLDRYTEDRYLDVGEAANLRSLSRALKELGWAPGDAA